MGKIGRRVGLGAAWLARAATISCLLTLSACSSEDDDASSLHQLAFGACPSDLPGAKLGRGCARVEVPLRWDEPKGEQIELLVARYAGKSPGHGQLWMLDGGPGGTGAVYMLDQVLALYTSLGLDVYVPQHRGTGHSTPLACDSDDIRTCGEELVEQWGDGLQGFHSVEAGRDLGHLIERTQNPGEPTFVFGLSYGTYWAQRYLQSFPKQAKGVILEGVFPLYQPLWEGDVPSDTAGRSIFEACRDDEDCAAAFGSEDPEDVARRVLAKADDPGERCMGEDGPDRVGLEGVLSLLIVGDGAMLVPGLVRRFDRCSERDQEELLSFAAYLEDSLGEAPDAALDNQVLGTHVLRTDLLAPLESFSLEARSVSRSWSGPEPSPRSSSIRSWTPGPSTTRRPRPSSPTRSRPC